MSIPNKNFTEELRNKFISLLESKRGLQAKLSKSIDKPSSYFSEIKRGNPVNALHLKAVQIILGSKKVIELLDIDNKFDATSIVQNKNVMERFEDLGRIKNIINDLAILEKIDTESLDEIHGIIKLKIEMKKSLVNKSNKNRKKIS
tara:strand:+ start:201 stop:638 length:438 start_codon:yes stop_codon:yes gene_type:complete